jgi:hypothetical protein
LYVVLAFRQEYDPDIIVPKRVLIKGLLRHADLNLGSPEDRQILVQKLALLISPKRLRRILERAFGIP